MIEFIENHIFGILLIVCLSYIGIDLFLSRKKMSTENFRGNLKKFGNGFVNAGWKEFLFGIIIFIIVFSGVKFMWIAQNEAQNCNIWISYDIYQNRLMGLNHDYGGVDWDKIMSVAESWENNRSNNYYRREFKKIGGRPFFLNIECDFSLNKERFIKNIMLDYNEREK